MSIELIVVLLVAPLVGFLINGLFGKWLKGSEKLSGWIGTLAVLVSLVCSIIVFASLHGGAAPFDETLYEWITGRRVRFQYRLPRGRANSSHVVGNYRGRFPHPRVFHRLYARG